MKRDDETIDRIADRIAAGRSVDPSDTDAGGLGAADSAIVANLISLAKLSEFHRVPEPARIAPSREDADTWGPLRLLENVGEGAFGEVWRAWDTELHRQVALKLARGTAGGTPGGADAGARAARVDGGARDERTVEEGRLLAKVDHPNVVRIHGGATHAGRTGLWMEFVDGATLETLLRAGGPLDVPEAARIGRDLGRALGAIHDAGLVHGDVKAQNVMRGTDGRVVLMDFGAGTRHAGGGAAPHAGTPMYTPPEIFDGKPAGPRTDVFSLGVLLYAMLSGRFPVEAKSVRELAAKHRAGGAADLGALRPDLPGDLVRIVHKAIAADPDGRYATAHAVADALEPIAAAAAADAGTDDGAAAPAAASDRGGGFTAWAPWILALAAVATLLTFVLRDPLAPVLVAEVQLLRGSDPAVALATGDRVQPGDLLHLQLDLERKAHVYVLNRDDRGALSLLFPMPGYETENPLGAGPAALPGVPAAGGAPMAWRIGEGGGAERFLVIASRSPLREFEKELAGLPAPGAGASARAIGERAAEDLYRGVTGLAQLPAAASGGTLAGERLFALAKELENRDRGAVTVREFVLRNP